MEVCIVHFAITKNKNSTCLMGFLFVFLAPNELRFLSPSTPAGWSDILCCSELTMVRRNFLTRVRDDRKAWPSCNAMIQEANGGGNILVHEYITKTYYKARLYCDVPGHLSVCMYTHPRGKYIPNISSVMMPNMCTYRSHVLHPPQKI